MFIISYKADDLFKEQLSLDWDKKAKIRDKGRIITFKDVPILNVLRNKLADIVGEKLNAEGMILTNVVSAFTVIVVRLGTYASLLSKFISIGERIELMFHHNDIYIMSEKKRKILTLRHGTKQKRSII